jgi:AraC-like DNA-binding protein
MSIQQQPSPSMKTTWGQDLFAERLALADGVHGEASSQVRLCLVLETAGLCHISGLMDDCVVRVNAGELWIIPANFSVQWQVGLRMLRLDMRLGLQSSSLACAQFALLSELPASELEDLGGLAILRPQRLLDSTLIDYARMAAQNNLSAFEAPFLNALAQMLFIHLAARSSMLMAASQHAPVFDQDAQNVAVLRSFVDERLAYDLGVEDLAKQVQMSKFQLLRVMKKHFAQTPQQFVIQRRIERAKSLLRGSNASLADIAFQTGFSSQSHLSNTFKQLVGNTPKAYRDGVGLTGG